MFDGLAHHPFGVEAFFRRSLVLTFALPPEHLLPLLGPGLVLDTYTSEDGAFGFVAIALVETEGLRPKGFPAWLGRSFFLSGYRIFARFERPGKAPMRGLKILRSDTDKWTMSKLGNLFTHYNYSLSEVTTNATATRYEVRVKTSTGEGDLHVIANLSGGPAPLPDGSVFRSMDDALGFAGPLPFTFSYDEKAAKMVVIKGLRKAWGPAPVAVELREAAFFNARFAPDVPARLANAFYVENIPYAWKPGMLEDLP
jgi:Uncharacterized conserved protein (COG2071)